MGILDNAMTKTIEKRKIVKEIDLCICSIETNLEVIKDGQNFTTNKEINDRRVLWLRIVTDSTQEYLDYLMTLIE